MKELKISTGVETYKINDSCEIQLNPTDYNFISNLFNSFEVMEEKDKKWREDVQKATDARKVLDLYSDGDKRARETIDNVLGDGVSNAVFGNVNCMALADGLPIWMNLILAIIDEMDSTFAQAQKQANPKINKYLKKYHN